jgi:adenylyl-sulfate kinase
VASLVDNGFTLWFTGMSGAGKSTLASNCAEVLRRAGRRVEVLDGDEIRRSLSKGLGFSRADRDENIRRIGFVADLLSRNGVVAISAAISPYRDAREEVRKHHSAPFVEIFVDCSMEELVRRDVKGLYARALRGDLSNLTGVNDAYEPPVAPDVHLRTDQESVGESLQRIVDDICRRGLLGASDCQALRTPR